MENDYWNREVEACKSLGEAKPVNEGSLKPKPSPIPDVVIIITLEWALRQHERIIVEAQRILALHLEPEHGTDTEAVNALLGLLDSQSTLKAQASAKTVLGWAEARNER